MLDKRISGSFLFSLLRAVTADFQTRTHRERQDFSVGENAPGGAPDPPLSLPMAMRLPPRVRPRRGDAGSGTPGVPMGPTRNSLRARGCVIGLP
jgi:hypothetical protein